MPALHNITWVGDASSGHLRLLDQTKLPTEETYLECTTVQHVWDAIKRLSVRGVPAIGIAAAYGCVIGVRDAVAAGIPPDDPAITRALHNAAAYLAMSRPTAVNLFWALDRMKRVSPCTPAALLREAKKIHEEDAVMCKQIGEHGLKLIEGLLRTPRSGPGAGVSNLSKPQTPNPRPALLTHCNAGALATGGIGTATAPMYLAQQRGIPFTVFADETRPLLQGSRLTAFELQHAGIDVTLITDGMAAQVMREGRIGLVIVGADRIARNGDAANKIGTYNLAVLAKYHAVPFYVAAPSSTFDLSITTGADIPIEERGGEEITEAFGKRTAPAGVKTYSPAFDVTPHDLITGIITERGIIAPVDTQTVTAMIGG